MDVDKELLKEVSALKELTDTKKMVEEVVEEVVEKMIEETLKVQEVQDIEEVKTIIRTVETIELQKTFQCCLPFLSKFWEKKKPE